MFVSSYPDSPKGSVLFLSDNHAKLRSQIEKEYQTLHKKVNKTEDTREGRNRKQRVREKRRNTGYRACQKCIWGGYMRQEENKGAKN